MKLSHDNDYKLL